MSEFEDLVLPSVRQMLFEDSETCYACMVLLEEDPNVYYAIWPEDQVDAVYAEPYKQKILSEDGETTDTIDVVESDVLLNNLKDVLNNKRPRSPLWFGGQKYMIINSGTDNEGGREISYMIASQTNGRGAIVYRGRGDSAAGIVVALHDLAKGVKQDSRNCSLQCSALMTALMKDIF